MSLINLGQRLKTARLERDDPQKEFAFRIGVSIPTLHNMEQGSPKVSIGFWIKALSIIGKLDELNGLIAPQQSLAERFTTFQKIQGRQRVRKKK
ncbi:MAG: helix-turn-helix domain-containing protein [Desulfobacteraceae bacterium]|nr:helix-turn-helix domain-containing protein [Desulfobacteraceae bacterium]